MKTLTEILQEELTAIQDLLEAWDQLIIESKDIRLVTFGSPVALGFQAVAAILEERHAKKD